MYPDPPSTSRSTVTLLQSVHLSSLLPTFRFRFLLKDVFNVYVCLDKHDVVLRTLTPQNALKAQVR